jgi:hypothetical protein
MGRLRPYDTFTVALGYNEETLTDRRRAIVAGAELAMINNIPEVAQLSHPALESHTFTSRTGLIVYKLTPRLEFLDIL